MQFHDLQGRLLALLRNRIQNGELTERSLAKLTGISQPHVHNVLKGVRILSVDLADVILARLQISVLDLFDRKDLVEFLSRSPGSDLRFRSIPVLEGMLGPGFAAPRQVVGGEVHSVPPSLAASLTQPVVARLADDPEMETLFQAGDMVLLDQSETSRTFLQPNSYYVVNDAGAVLVRLLRREPDAVLVISEKSRERPAGWRRLSFAGKDILEIVLARVVWLNRQRRWNDIVR